MSRGRDNATFLPDIEEPTRYPTPQIEVAEGSTPSPPVSPQPLRRVQHPRTPEPLPSHPTVTMTPQAPRDTPTDIGEMIPRRRKKHTKDEDELIIGILNMLMSRVDQNSANINKYVHKRFEDDDGSNNTIKRKDKVPVEIRVIFMKVIDVDTLKQDFKAEIFVQARWQDPSLKLYTEAQLQKVHGDQVWTPKIIVTNIVGDPDEDETWYLATKYPDFKYPTVTMRRKITGAFSEILELNDFPLDVQELTVQVSTRRSEKEVMLIQDNYRMSTVNVDGFLDQDQFELYPHVITSSGHMSSELTSMKDRHSAIFFSASVKRKSAYFFWNIFLMMFIISTLAFTAFGIPPTNPHNRLAVNLTLLLTAIAFKFIINKSIPQIPYLTFLDIYVIGCMILLAAHAVENAVITAFSENKANQSSIDYYLLYFLATCHVSFNVAFVIFLIIMNYRANSQVEERNEEFKHQQKEVGDRRRKLQRQVDEDMYTPRA